jgi:VanZ family protein
VGQGGIHKGYLFAAAIIGAAILYGSLFPFDFRQPGQGPGPVQALLESGGRSPWRADFLANVLLYLPLGFFASLALGGRVLSGICFATISGTLLSIAMELAQYYDAGRVTSLDDVYADVLGTALGAVIGVSTWRDNSPPLFRLINSNPVPCLLLALWLGYRLFPYIPAVDLHKYWNALKPVVLYPRPTGYELFRYTAMWLTTGALLECIGGAKRAWLPFALFIGSVLIAKILVVGRVLSMAELAGAGLAFGLWLVLVTSTSPRLRVSVAALMLVGSVVTERLAPLQFTAHARQFGWIPFYSFMYGSLQWNIVSFLEKSFLYGSLVWLISKTGIRLGVSTSIVASMLFITSWAQTYLPNRSAEITDTVMALIIGAIIPLIEAEKRATPPLSIGRRLG